MMMRSCMCEACSCLNQTVLSNTMRLIMIQYRHEPQRHRNDPRGTKQRKLRGASDYSDEL